jgi:DNA polymerase-1
MTSAKKRLFILDANALMHRAWHALPPLTNSKGQVVNAVYGTMMVMMKLFENERPDACVACWDTEAATFRHEAYKEYKAHREEQPDELYAQIPLIQAGLATLGVDSLELDGYEADDLIGTIATRAHRDGWEVVIVTSDRDALQLVRPGISVLAFKKGVTDTITYDEAEVKSQYGLTPAQFLEYKMMRGDPSDNIPGIKGIGEKGATDLLQRFETLEGIMAAAHDATSDLTKSTREKLLAAEGELPALRSLVTIVHDAPIAWDIHPLVLRNEQVLHDFLREMGFKALLKKQQISTASGDEKAEDVDVLPVSPKGEASKQKVAYDASAGCVIERVESVEDMVRAVARIREAKEVVVHLARGVQGSLFGEAIESVIFGIGPSMAVDRSSAVCLFEVSTGLIRKQTKVKALCQELLETNGLGLLAHDAKLQMKGLRGLGLQAERWVFDVMLGAYVLGAGERNHDLPSVVERYTGVVLAEDAAPLKQAEMIVRVVEAVRAEVIAQNLMDVLQRFDLPLVPVLARMEEAGIRIDREYLGRLTTEFRADRARLEQEMVEMARRAFNPASPTQLAEVLFVDLALSTKGIKKGKTGYSTAASELEKLRGQHPIIEKIEDYREVSKLLSTYVEVLPLLADADGRVHTTFNQAIAATGRLSSTDPNLQNIPIRTELGRRIRGAFVAPQGRVLVSCDYSQIELRLAAALSKDAAMTEAFVRGEDIHQSTAAKIWGIPLVDVTKDQRRAAKAINFGILYGQGAHGLAATAGIPYAEAKKFIEKYFEVYSGFRTYIDETKALARARGFVETFFGRRRPMSEILSAIPMLRAQAERMAVNMPLQGTAADLMKLAMIDVDKKLGSVCGEAKMLLQVHDELVLEVPEKDAQRVAMFVKETMEGVEKMGVPIVVDMKIGGSWAEME